jgi:hypothetical protein
MPGSETVRAVLSQAHGPDQSCGWGCEAFTPARRAGHSTITITQRYCHPQADAIEQAFTKLAKSRELVNNGSQPALAEAANSNTDASLALTVERATGLRCPNLAFRDVIWVRRGTTGQQQVAIVSANLRRESPRTKEYRTTTHQ